MSEIYRFHPPRILVNGDSETETCLAPKEAKDLWLEAAMHVWNVPYPRYALVRSQRAVRD